MCAFFPQGCASRFLAPKTQIFCQMNTAPSTPVDSSRYVKLKRSVQLAIHALFDAAPFASFIASFPLEIQVKHPDVLAYHYDVFRKSIEANVMQEFEVLMSNNQDPQKRFKFLDYLVTLEDGTLMYVHVIKFYFNTYFF